TPGRLLDLVDQKHVRLNTVSTLIIDEADRMFDMGFIKDIYFLLRKLPPIDQRQSMLFSATLAQRVMELAYEHMNYPVTVKIEPDKVTADNVTEILYMPSMREKVPLLIGLLKRMEATRTIVFVNTKRGCDMVAAYLQGNGFKADVLSGDVAQNKRLRLLREFQAGELPILVTTDVASRGLHIPAVSHVFNYDLPQDAEDYVHRIGRTARAGAGGKAISLVDESSALALEAIEKFIGQKIAVEWADDDLFMQEIKPTAEERRRYSEERRARLAARDRFGDRDRGRRGGGGRPHGRPHGEPSQASRPPAAPPPPSSPPPSAEGRSGQRRRRRRGGRGSRPEGSPPQGPPSQ
ncbi:MAG TPA: helicase-related protein, partial [Methylomirabilota bacterium]|nr:helicase-related protein [Methylomirabilota bacterium]